MSNETQAYDVLVQVRFHPDGKVWQINERPDGVDVQSWFDHLCKVQGKNFRALSGGRGSFQLSADEVADARQSFVA
jgi:hypothetical protein